MTKKDAIVSTSQAAKILGVTPQTVRRLVERGEIEAQRVVNGYHGRLMLASSEVEHLKAMRELQRAGKTGKKSA